MYNVFNKYLGSHESNNYLIFIKIIKIEIFPFFISSSKSLNTLFASSKFLIRG